jgi:peptidoglycan hydrolase-like protein with peptidoglycan-binding domain
VDAPPTAPVWAQDEALDDGAGPEQRPRRLSRRLATVGALLAAACAVVAIVLLESGGGKGGAPATGVPAGYTTATVTRRTLTESASVDGTLGYGTSMELYDRLAGTFTWLPSVGATIARGGTLFRVDNLPVVLMYGSTPAYRTLKQGVSDGPDVAELNDNLIALGYDPYGAITASSPEGDVEAFGQATAEAVRRWQKAEGLAETGEVELGRVVFAPSARRVTTVHVTLGQDPPPATNAPAGPSASEAQKPGASKPSPRAGKPKSHKRRKRHEPSKAGKPRGAARTGDDSPENDGDGAPKESPSGDDAGGSPSGEDAAAAQAEVALTTTSTQQLVQLKLKAEQQQLAHVGELAPVSLPGGGVVRGRIAEVGTVAAEAKSGNDGESEKGPGGSSGEDTGESATIPVTLVLTRRVPHLDEAPVSVELVKSVRENVLAVPATALFATAGGRYAIEAVEGARRVDVPVAPGMFANGYVQVEGRGVHEGQAVIESE